METSHLKTDDNQGTSTPDRNPDSYRDTSQNERLKERGISNGGGQRSDQTSNRDSAHKPERKKRITHSLL